MAEKKATISLQFSGQTPVKLRLYAASDFGCDDPERFRVKQGEAWIRFDGEKTALVDVGTIMDHVGNCLRERLALDTHTAPESPCPTFHVGQLVTMRGELMLEGKGKKAGLVSEVFRIMSPPIRDEFRQWQVAVGKGPRYAATCAFVPCCELQPLRRCV